MTGPLAFFTTSRSGDTLLAGTGGAAGGGKAACCCGVAGEQPVITAVAPMRALRIMNARLSTPAGISAGCSSRSGRNGSLRVVSHAMISSI